MEKKTIVLERTLNAPVSIVWSALTNKEKMNEWYFKMSDFKPEVGFEFTTVGGKEKEYLHLFKITEAIPNKKLAYTWAYDGYPGSSVLTFELFDEGDKTKLKLTHEGLETFADNGPDFQLASFNKGWDSIINTNLKNYVEKK